MPDPEIDVIRALLSSRPRPSDLSERRERLDALGAQYSLPADVRVEAVDANGVVAEWTTTPEAKTGRAILFLHGGGYISGSLDSHRHMIAQAGREARSRTLALAYRLAPEHPFPAALEDALGGYAFLLAQGFDPKNIAIAGESAGGGLAVATLTSIRDAGMNLPACAWLSSPWVDLEMAGASMSAKSTVDPLIQKSYLQELAAMYLGGVDARTPLASPIHANLSRLPPMLIQVGLRRDLARRCRAARQRRRCGRCPADAGGLAGHDPCLASLLPAGRGGPARACRGRRFHALDAPMSQDRGRGI